MDPNMKEFEARVKDEVSKQHFTQLGKFTTPAECKAHYQAVLLKILAKDLILKGQAVTAHKMIQHVEMHVNKMPVWPRTLEEYCKESPLYEVIQAGAVESLKALMHWMKKATTDKGVVHAAMCDVVTAGLSHEVSYGMIGVFLNADAPFDSQYHNGDGVPFVSVVVRESRMDILDLLCQTHPDANELDMSTYVTKKGLDETYQLCGCKMPSCHVKMHVAFYNLNFHLYHGQPGLETMCRTGLDQYSEALADQERALKFNRDPAEYDEYDEEYDSPYDEDGEDNCDPAEEYGGVAGVYDENKKRKR